MLDGLRPRLIIRFAPVLLITRWISASELPKSSSNLDNEVEWRRMKLPWISPVIWRFGQGKWGCHWLKMEQKQSQQDKFRVQILSRQTRVHRQGRGGQGPYGGHVDDIHSCRFWHSSHLTLDLCMLFVHDKLVTAEFSMILNLWKQLLQVFPVVTESRTEA